MSPPSLPDLIVTHWQPASLLTLEAPAAVALYLWGTRRVRRRWPPARTAAFIAGVGSIVVALESGIDAFDDQLLSVHMVQHLILLELAPILLLSGRPDRLALLALPTAARGALGRCLIRLRRWTHPAVALGVFWVVVLATHVPAFYDLTLRQPALHDAEHGLYLLAGLLLWWPLLGPDAPARWRLGGYLQLAYVLVAMLPMELIGAILSRQLTLAYPAYAGPARALGISAVVDQEHAGAIMWVAGGTLMVLVVLWTATRAMIEEERRQRVRDAQAVEVRLP